MWTPEPGPTVTSMRKSPGFSPSPPGLMAHTWPGGSGSAPISSGLLQLGRGDELLDAVLAEGVAEVGVAELHRADALLLLLHPPAALEREAHGPLDVLVGDGHLAVGVEELEQAVDGLVDRGHVAPAQGTAEEHAALEGGQAGVVAQPAPGLGDEVGDEAEVLGEEPSMELGDVPAWGIGVDAVHEGGVVLHLLGERPEEVADPLLVGDVDVEVADHDDAARRPGSTPCRG